MKFTQAQSEAMHQHLQTLLDISDYGHPDFVDSGAEVIQVLWDMPVILLPLFDIGEREPV